MVAPIALIAGAAASVALSELFTGPLANILDTAVPYKEIAPRAALRMVATGALTPPEYFELDAFQELAPKDQAIAAKYAHYLYDAYSRTQTAAVMKPFVKEQTDVLKALDDGATAKFLGALDDAQSRLKAVEAELQRLDKAEREAWMQGELAFNSLLTRIVEEKIRKSLS